MREKPLESGQDQPHLVPWGQPLKARYAPRQEGQEGQEQSEDQQSGNSSTSSNRSEDEQQASSNSQKDSKSPISSTNPWTFALNTGFFAGLIWGGLRITEYYFKFTHVHPTFLIKPWSNPTFNQTNLGYMTGWAAFILFSIIVSLIYATVLRKVRGAWVGMLYGLVWWVILYFAVGPRMGMMKPIGKIEWNSLITDGCLFLLWGAFIGYTISFEFTDEQQREPSVSLG